MGLEADFSIYNKSFDKKKMDELLIAYGLILIVCNVISLASYYIVHNNSVFSLTWEDLGSIMMIIAGIAILVNPKRSILSAVGTSAMAIAIGKIPKDIGYMTYENVGLGVSSTVMFIVGLVLLILAGNLFYSGVMYYVGVCRGYFWHMVSISLIALIDLFTALIVAVYEVRTGDPVRALQLCVVNMPILIVYAVYIYLLNHDLVRDSLHVEKIHTRLNHICAAEVPEDDTAISRSDAELLIKGPESWPPVNGYGPVEAELKFILSHSFGDSYCTVQKWKDDDRLFYTITDTDDGTFIEAARFSSVMIGTDTGDISTCSRIIFYDRDGVDRSLPVFDPIGGSE